VTGVQTCALPIFRKCTVDRVAGGRHIGRHRYPCAGAGVGGLGLEVGADCLVGGDRVDAGQAALALGSLVALGAALALGSAGSLLPSCGGAENGAGHHASSGRYGDGERISSPPTGISSSAGSGATSRSAHDRRCGLPVNGARVSSVAVNVAGRSTYTVPSAGGS